MKKCFFFLSNNKLENDHPTKHPHPKSRHQELSCRCILSNLLLKENHPLKNREMHIKFIGTVNDTVNPKIDTVNDTVFSLIKQNNQITTTEIGKRLNISLSTVRRRIKNLKEKGEIERIGSDKSGYWKIVENKKEM